MDIVDRSDFVRLLEAREAASSAVTDHLRTIVRLLPSEERRRPDVAVEPLTAEWLTRLDALRAAQRAADAALDEFLDELR